MLAKVVILMTILAAATSETIIDINAAGECGATHNVGKDDVIRLLGYEQDNSTSCVMTFNSVADGGCDGLCYMFNHYSVIKDSNVNFVVDNGTETVTYDSDNRIQHVPFCGLGTSMTATLTLSPGYAYNENVTGYIVIFDVYHQCGERGNVQNIDFQTALLYINGYKHGAARDAQEHKAFVEGILVGFGFAAFFVIIFIVGRCYTHWSPKN